MFRRPFLVALMLAAASLPSAAGQDEPGADRTVSPYFFVKGADPSLDQFPMKSTTAQVDIVGVIARVKVTQVYANEGSRPLEAIYIFPGSTRAAVYGMKMTIGERTITARIEERQKARQQYEAARDSGRTASLLEQQRPNVFQMNVANILPGDQVKVELSYTEMLVPEHGIYEFVYPTVVGPRYAKAGSGGSGIVPVGTDGRPADIETWTRNPYLRKGTKSPATFDFRARIVTGIPLQELTSPSHKMAIDFPARDRANVALASEENSGGNRDVVLRYRLADNRIETGVLLGSNATDASGGQENFFVCMLEPPRRFAAAAIPTREYVFIVDVSGSMHGFPLDTSKELLRNLLDRLRPTDYFNVLFFSGGSYVLSPTSLEATELNRKRALTEIERQQGAGGTELLPALHRAFSLPRMRPDASRVVVIATDGYVNVEREAFTLIRRHLNDTNVFAFGIGSSVNRHLIEGMARVGEGTPFVVLKPEEAEATAERFREYIESPLLTHIEVRFPGFAAYDLEPATVPDLFADRPIVLAGKFHGAPSGEIVITGFTGQGRFEKTVKVTASQPVAAADALKYLWARERLALLSDFASADGDYAASREEITRLGLTYGLLTEFTSFVAIDEHVRRQDGKVETVKQPLPLPEGVSNRAVGVGGSNVKMIGSAQSFGVAAPMDAIAEVAGGLMARRRVPQAGPVPPTVGVRILENRLSVTPALAEARLREIVEGALSRGRACFSGSASGTLRLKLFFSGSRTVSRIELLDPQQWKNQPGVSSCVQAAAQRSLTLPSAATGYLVIAIAR